MNKFLHHLKSKGYEINGNTAMLLGIMRGTEEEAKKRLAMILSSGSIK